MPSCVTEGVPEQEAAEHAACSSAPVMVTGNAIPSSHAWKGAEGSFGSCITTRPQVLHKQQALD